jgi:2-polyprenyl-3-methyl-5-hydroxy-6-metoxy-1,4-benzoquinol methylase
MECLYDWSDGRWSNAVAVNLAVENYDEVPYISKAFKDTHPQALALITAMAGLETAPPNRCRVLEIGCAGGGNLLPMAEVFPNSQFVGVDISSVQIEQARAMARAAGIGNAEFHCGDIRQFTPDGEFDFIICHGVYSWVAGDVRDRMLAMCREHLSPRGVTFISHMTLPGAFGALALRRAMQLTQRGKSPGEIAAVARFTASTMAELSQRLVNSWGPVVAGSAKQIPAVDSDLLHDQLAESYHAVYLGEFVDHAAKFGLRYLSDMERHDANDLHAAVREPIEAMSSEPVVQMELLDIARCRTYRQSVLARSDAPLTTPNPAAVVERCYLASEKLGPSTGPISAEVQANGTSPDQLIAAALRVLAGRWPKTMAFAELAQRIQIDGARDPDRILSRVLLQLHRIGYVELWLHEPTYIGDGSDPTKARTSKLARAQAASKELITNLRHTPFERHAEPPRNIVAALDGRPLAPETLVHVEWMARASMLVAE